MAFITRRTSIVNPCLGMALLATLLLGQPSYAGATYTWDTTSGTWATSGNWSPGSGAASPFYPNSNSTSSGDTALFDTSGGGIVTIGASAQNVAVIQFSGSAGSYTFSNSTGSTTSGGFFDTAGIGGSSSRNSIYIDDTVTATTTTVETFNAPIVLGGGTGFDNDAASANVTLSIIGNVSGAATTGTQTLYLNGNNTGNNTISGVISDGTGGGALALYVGEYSNGGTAGGGGTWILSNASNSFSGGVDFLGTSTAVPTLSVSSMSALGTNGTITWGNASNSKGYGTLLYTGTGETTSKNIYADTEGSTIATISQSGSGLLDFAGSVTSLGATGHTPVLLLEGSTSGTGEISGSISNPTAGGTFAVSKSGSGMWILSGSNSYTGATTISAGTLDFAAEDSLYGSTSGSVLDAASVTVANGATMALGVGGSGYFDAADVATVLADAKFSSGANIGFDTSNANSGTFTYASAITNTTGGGTNPLGVVALGTGALTFTSNGNTYSGGTTVSAGTFYANNTVASSSATGTGTVTVSKGATLAGTGYIAPSVSAGTAVVVAPGGNITPGGVQSAPNYNWMLNSGAGPINAPNGKLTLNPASVNPSATLLSVGAGTIVNPSLTFALGTNASTPGTISSSEIVVAEGGSSPVSNTINFNAGGTGSTTSMVSINDLVSASLQLNMLYVLIQGNGSTTFDDNGVALSDVSLGNNLYRITDGLSLLPASSGNFFAGWYSGSYLVFDSATDSIDVEVVPEPSTWALMLGGLGFLVFWMRQRNRRGPWGR